MPGKMGAPRLVILCDTREQAPLDFSRWPDVQVEAGTLRAGDYSLKGLERQFGIERKSLPDLVSSITTGRERLERELDVLKGFAVAAIVVEGTMDEVRRHRYRSQTSPESVLQTLAAWQVRYGVPTIWAGSPAGAAYMVRALARHYLRIATESLAAIVKAHGEVPPPGPLQSAPAPAGVGG